MKSPKKSPRGGSLSAGTSLGASFRRKGPSLAAGGGDKETPAPNGTGGSVLAILFRGVIALLFVGALLIAALWLVLGVTVLPVLRVDGTAWAVKWAAWPEGGVPTGSIVMAETGAKRMDIPGRLGMLLDAGTSRAVVEVVAGPGGEIRADIDNRIYLNGFASPWVSAGPLPTTRIGDRYLVVCIAGESCIPGTASLLPVSAVLGEVLGSVSLSPSLGPVPRPPLPPAPSQIPAEILPMPTESPVSPQPSSTAEAQSTAAPSQAGSKN